MAHKATLIDRETVEVLRKAYWSRFEGRDPDECWFLPNKPSGNGYVNITYCKRTHPAHRVAALISGYTEDLLLVVRHSCDVRTCVNPNHVSFGTQAQNMRDRWDRGQRGRRSAPLARRDTLLSAEQVREIRKSTVSNAELARRFGCSSSTISNARLGLYAYSEGLAA